GEGRRAVERRAADEPGDRGYPGPARALHAADLRGRTRAPGTAIGSGICQGGRSRGDRSLWWRPAGSPRTAEHAYQCRITRGYVAHAAPHRPTTPYSLYTP